jgi:glycosyltransferase involved in cell wall biosynthesis
MTIEFSIPVLNEEKILKKNILELYNFCQKNLLYIDWQIVVAVNCSTDRSLAICQELAAEYDKIKYMNYEEKGRGRSIKKTWLKSQADIVAYMDVDLAVSLDNIHDLVKPFLNSQADLVIGSRLMSASKIKRSFIREFVSQTHLYISKIILHHNFSDLQCGFKAIRQQAFSQIANYVNNTYWFFDTELIFFAKKAKLKIIEIPVDWSENRYDERKSKVNVLTDSLRALANLLKLRFKSLFKF